MELVDGEVQALGCIEYKVTREILKGYFLKLDIGNSLLKALKSLALLFISK